MEKPLAKEKRHGELSHEEEEGWQVTWEVRSQSPQTTKPVRVRWTSSHAVFSFAEPSLDYSKEPANILPEKTQVFTFPQMVFIHF